MKWQVEYALGNFNNDNDRSSAEYIRDDIIRVKVKEKPDVIAAISAAVTINQEIAEHYVLNNPDIDFLCGYRTECVWEGPAISYLERKNIGWGTFGTLNSGALDGNANFVGHKIFSFAARLINQYGIVDKAKREFDRVFQLTLKNGHSIRVGLIPDYEPTSDNIRSLWGRFGPFDIVWNINPNGEPCATAFAAGQELGCKVLKTEGMKKYLQTL